MGSTPTTGETPGASANAKAYASILPGVFYGDINSMVEPGQANDRDERSIPSCRHKALAVEPFVSRFGKSGTTHRVARSIKSTDLTAGNRPALTSEMIMAQMYVESRGDYRVISHKNCHGAMQVNPVTGKEHGYPEWSLTHPVIGMAAGISIMSKLWSRWHFVTNSNERWKLSLAAYNCGLSRTLRSVRLGRKWQRGIPIETRKYIVKVMNRYYGRNNGI